LGGAFLIFTASVGVLWAISNMDAAPDVVAEPVPLVINAPVVEEPTEIAQDVYTYTIEEPDPNAIFVDYAYLPWNLKLVNRYNVMHPDFEPYLSSIGNGHYFDARAADSLVAMLDSARSQGLSPMVVSGHRSISRQRTLFNNQYNRQLERGLSSAEAHDAARRVVAYPGESEHNLGLAVDIVAVNYTSLTASFGQTPEGIWLANNSYRYGFVLRYPHHKQDITHIIYEPWHFRYVGVAHATAMFERDLVLEEYLQLLVFNNEN
jgi:D-alanyl-D-alanine carboxypeptidase